jgi:predicted 3-demethylubiquinone-9 3-methyltransferase (glyoxalase superfamily)
MAALTTCLWFDGEAEEAARFYTEILPDSRIDQVVRSPADYPSGKAGDVITVDFTLLGGKFLGLNGGAEPRFNHSISLVVPCETQEEVDRYWDALLEGGGSPVQCGWLTDRFGLSWQITPTALARMMADTDQAAAKRAMEAMMGMVKLDIAALERAFRG